MPFHPKLKLLGAAPFSCAGVESPGFEMFDVISGKSARFPPALESIARHIGVGYRLRVGRQKLGMIRHIVFPKHFRALETARVLISNQKNVIRASATAFNCKTRVMQR